MVLNFGVDSTFAHKSVVLQSLIGEFVALVTHECVHPPGTIIGCAGHFVWIGDLEASVA